MEIPMHNIKKMGAGAKDASTFVNNIWYNFKFMYQKSTATLKSIATQSVVQGFNTPK